MGVQQPIAQREILVDDAAKVFAAVHIVSGDADAKVDWGRVLSVAFAQFP